MKTLEQFELEAHQGDIIADVKSLTEKYRAIFDWDVPDIDQDLADRMILAEIRKALDQVEDDLPVIRVAQEKRALCP